MNNLPEITVQQLLTSACLLQKFILEQDLSLGRPFHHPKRFGSSFAMRFNIQCATLKDTELLAGHRLSMWRDILPELATCVTDTEERTIEWIREKLSLGKLVGFIAKTEEGQVAGSGCIWIREQPPLPMSQLLEVPYLMSLYTEKEFRRKGVARLIAETAIAWCRTHDYDRVNLDASEAGKSLYKTLGFKPGYGMRLQL